MKIKDLLPSLPALQILMNSPQVKPLAGYKLAVMFKRLKDELDTYEEMRMAACQRFGRLEQNSNQFVFDTESAKDECTEVIKQLQEAELNTVIPKFTFEELFTADASLRPSELMPLVDVILVEG